MKKKWASNAEWSDHTITTDYHYTQDEAKSVCRMLERDGFGGDGVHFPLRTWTEEV